MKQRSLLSFLTQNLGLKLIAFSSSLGIWLWVQTKQTTQEKVRSEVQYILPKDLVLLNQPSPLVTISLEGPKGTMRQLKNMELKTKINLSAKTEGAIDAEFNTNDIINLPAGVKVLQFFPPGVNVVFDEKLTRTLKIEPNISGTPQRGWKLVETAVHPETVTVTGAQTVLGTVASINTMGISLSERKTTSIESILLEPTHHSFVFENLETVEVTLVLEEEVLDKIFSDIPIIAPKGWIITPQQTDILIKGPLLAIEELTKENLTLQWQPPEDWDQTSPLNPIFELYTQGTLLAYPFQVQEKTTFKKEPR